MRRDAAGRVALGLLLVLISSALACGRAPSPRHPAAPAPISSVAPEAYLPPEVPSGWLGGNREVTIAAPPHEVMAVLVNPESYRHLLASVRSLRVVRQLGPEHFLVEVEQGTSLVKGTYSAHLLRERDDLVRFWIDRDLPHDVDDAYGFFLIGKNGEGTRLRYHVAVDLGGAFAWMFSGSVERSALSTAERTRRYVEGSRGARAGAATPPTR